MTLDWGTGDVRVCGHKYEDSSSDPRSCVKDSGCGDPPIILALVGQRQDSQNKLAASETSQRKFWV